MSWVGVHSDKQLSLRTKIKSSVQFYFWSLQYYVQIVVFRSNVGQWGFKNSYVAWKKKRNCKQTAENVNISAAQFFCFLENVVKIADCPTLELATFCPGMILNAICYEYHNWNPDTNLLKMPFLGTIWILPKSRLISNFGAIFTGPRQAIKMAQKFKIEFVRIQIIPKNGIFRYSTSRIC